MAARHSHESIASSIFDTDDPAPTPLARLDVTAALVPSNLDIQDDTVIPPSGLNLLPHLTFVNGLALVISLQIGSGIFSAPSLVSSYVTTPVQAVVLWLLGGVLVFTGAMAFAELGIRIPHNGGMQEYLRSAYGDFAGCAFTWTWVTIAKPSSVAVTCMILSDYFCRTVLPVAWLSTSTLKLVALFGLALVTFINCLGIRSGAVVANGFLCLKIFLLASITISGLTFFLASGTVGSHVANPARRLATDSHTTLVENSFSNYVTAFFGVLYCYGGWESIGFVAGEMKDPVRDLPRILKVAMSSVTAGFVLYNIALYCVMPIETIRDTKTPAIEFGLRLFGTAGGVVYSLLVAASAMGSLNANVYATGRVYVSAAERGYLPAFFKETPDETTQIANEASRSLITNACVISIYILGGTFDSLVTFVGIAEYTIICLTVLGVFIIRRRSPRPVPYTAHWLFISIFCSASLVLVLRGVFMSPLQGLSIGLCIATSWLLYRSILSKAVTSSSTGG